MTIFDNNPSKKLIHARHNLEDKSTRNKEDQLKTSVNLWQRQYDNVVGYSPGPENEVEILAANFFDEICGRPARDAIIKCNSDFRKWKCGLLDQLVRWVAFGVTKATAKDIVLIIPQINLYHCYGCFWILLSLLFSLSSSLSSSSDISPWFLNRIIYYHHNYSFIDHHHIPT